MTQADSASGLSSRPSEARENRGFNSLRSRIRLRLSGTMAAAIRWRVQSRRRPRRSAPLKKILPASLKFCGLVLQKKKAFSDDSDGGPGSQSKDSGGPTDELYRRPSRNDRSPAPHGSERRMQGLSPGTTLLLVEDKPDASRFARNPPSHSELIKGASQLVTDRLTINPASFTSDYGPFPVALQMFSSCYQPARKK